MMPIFHISIFRVDPEDEALLKHRLHHSQPHEVATQEQNTIGERFHQNIKDMKKR
jgi:hypothetical protein